MTKKSVVFSLLLVILINSDLFSQSRLELKNNFYDAESWILFEDYKEALPLYQELLTKFPDNSNIKYRIGQCYINTRGEKKKAISYLEDAVKNIDPKYKEGKFRETGAPYDALYFLANAYRINNQLDKAIETYNLFKKNLNSDVYDSTIVNFQIQSCLNAKELMSMPLYIKSKDLGSNINGIDSEFDPVISENEDMLVFSRSEAFYDAILLSTKINGQWTSPLNMNEMLKVDKDIYPTSLSSDKKTLYLYSSADYDGVILKTQLQNGVWSPLIKLNDNINTKYWESHATISHDGKKLYFTSNRKGTLGGLDIYVCTRDSTGDWGQAVNLGPTINTPYNEDTPFLSQDDKTLFFSSRGHFNMGGYDIFYSSLLDNGEWSVPLNVGYPMNTTDDDLFFDPINKGYEGYYTKDSPEGLGKQDIYRIEIFSDNHPRKFFIRGMVKYADLLSYIKDSVKISAMNIKNPNQTLVVYSNPETGEYEFQLPQGNYRITYEGHNGQEIVKNIDLPLTNPSDSFVLPGTSLPKTDFVAELTVEANKNISVARGDSILFPLRVEPKSYLSIQQWVGDSLLSDERFFVKDSIFNYKIVPRTGKNKITFKLTDRFNNTTTTDVLITRQKNRTEQSLIRPEYSRVIAKKQIEALLAMLRNRADDKLKKVIDESSIEGHQFGKVDDLISYLKEEAAKQDISSEDVDKLALKVAVLDNVLTQAAVDLMSKYSDDYLKKILSEIDIYRDNLKTWTDLQKYIQTMTEGKITPEDLNKIAAEILAETDPGISVLRDKFLTYSENTETGSVVRQSITSIDLRNIKTRENWLSALYYESVKIGLTPGQLTDMFVATGSLPGTDVKQFLNELINQSEEHLQLSLKLLDTKEEKIKSPGDLLLFLINNKNKLTYPEEEIFKSIANLIITKDIPAGTIISNATTGSKSWSWILWVLIGAGLLIIFFFFRKKKKSKEK